MKLLKLTLQFIILFLGLYGGLHVYNFYSAWGGIGIIFATLIGFGIYIEMKFKK